MEAVKKLNNSLLDGHKLTLSLSRKKIQNVEEIQKLKEKVKAKLAGVAGASGQMEVFPKPRYDQVFAEGVAWLDGLEGPKDEGSGILKFSGEVWKSRARSDQELP